MSVRAARRVADSLLYEGYVLYPYRASAGKNRMRWQFGVVMPLDYAALDPSERSRFAVEMLAEPAADAELELILRFLQIRRRESADPAVLPWDEALEREYRVRVPVATVAAGAGGPLEIPVRFPGAEDRDPPTGMSWRSRPLRAVLILAAELVDSPYGLVRLRVAVDNLTRAGDDARTRQQALPFALVSAHVLVAVHGGRFVSLEDPPEWAREEADRCRQEGWWPCLAGPPGADDVVLAAPIIVGDHPQVAPESPGDLFDATEIDEILTLRTLAMTDDEKREARATDPLACALVDRVDGMPGEILERLHGAIRGLRPVRERPRNGAGDAVEQAAEAVAEDPATPWWDPAADMSVDPGRDSVEVGGVGVRRGSRVRLRPGARRADAQDMFLAGRVAVVEAVLFDVDGQVHVAVTPDGDPGADLTRGPGRFLFFAPDELEPVEVAS